MYAYEDLFQEKMSFPQMGLLHKMLNIKSNCDSTVKVQNKNEKNAFWTLVLYFQGHVDIEISIIVSTHPNIPYTHYTAP